MALTTGQLSRLIREELARTVLNEASPPPAGATGSEGWGDYTVNADGSITYKERSNQKRTGTIRPGHPAYDGIVDKISKTEGGWIAPKTDPTVTAGGEVGDEPPVVTPPTTAGEKKFQFKGPFSKMRARKAAAIERGTGAGAKVVRDAPEGKSEVDYFKYMKALASGEGMGPKGLGRHKRDTKSLAKSAYEQALAQIKADVAQKRHGSGITRRRAWHDPTHFGYAGGKDISAKDARAAIKDAYKTAKKRIRKLEKSDTGEGVTFSPPKPEEPPPTPPPPPPTAVTESLREGLIKKRGRDNDEGATYARWAQLAGTAKF